MAAAIHRPALVNNINSAFSPANIAASVARLPGPSSRADFLEISRRVGVLGTMNEAEFRRYRRKMNTVIPPQIQQILTVVHRAALYATPPIPMHIQINPAGPPSIHVTHTDQLISIVLNRPDPA